MQLLRGRSYEGDPAADVRQRSGQACKAELELRNGREVAEASLAMSMPTLPGSKAGATERDRAQRGGGYLGGEGLEIAESSHTIFIFTISLLS